MMKKILALYVLFIDYRIMHKAILLLTLSIVTTMAIVSVTDIVPEAEAKKASGIYNTKFGSETKHIVCGDRLCSEAPSSTESKQLVVKTNTKPTLCPETQVPMAKTCSSFTITGATVKTSSYDVSSKTVSVLIDSYSDGKFTVPLFASSIPFVLADNEEMDDVQFSANILSIEFYSGTSNIEIILD